MNKLKLHQFARWNREKWNEKNEHIWGKYGKNYFAWHTPVLDQDYKTVIDKYLTKVPSTICDLGTCSGEQAMEMAKLGHKVVGADVVDLALEKARAKAAEIEGIDVTFVKDDILDTKLEPNQFDLITDRGCFHSFYGVVSSELYINSIKSLLKPGAIFLIKTMSFDESRFRSVDYYAGKKHIMPYHFKSQELIDVFKGELKYLDNWQTVFQSKNVEKPAVAELAVFRYEA